MSAAVLLRAARHQRALTQDEVAARAAMSQSAIARIERVGSNPTVAVLERALSAAGVMLTVVPLPQVDVGQLRERLELSPAERLDAFESSHRNLNRLVSAARRVSATP